MKDLIIFDFETTGLIKTKDRPVQIGLIFADSETFEYDVILNHIVNPGIEVSADALKIHGIDQNRIAAAPKLHEILGPITSYFNEHIGSSLMIGGFNTSTFDMPMWISADPRAACMASFPHVDVLDLLYRYCPTLSSKKLENVYPELTGHSAKGAHGALMDCYFTLCVLQVIVEKTGKSVRELAEELREPEVYQIMPIGKNTGLPIDQVPWSWAKFMSEKASDMRPDLQATVDYVLRNNL